MAQKSQVKTSFEMQPVHENNYNLLQFDRKKTSVDHEHFLNDVYEQV